MILLHINMYDSWNYNGSKFLQIPKLLTLFHQYLWQLHNNKTNITITSKATKEILLLLLFTLFPSLSLLLISTLCYMDCLTNDSTNYGGIKYVAGMQQYAMDTLYQMAYFLYKNIYTDHGGQPHYMISKKHFQHHHFLPS